MSAAFMVGAFFTEKGTIVAVCFGIACLYASMIFTGKGSNDK
jgi:hypothetical protein